MNLPIITKDNVKLLRAKEADSSINAISSRNKEDDQEGSSRRKSNPVWKIQSLFISTSRVKRRRTSPVSEDPVTVHLEELQTTTDKTHLGGQVLISFAADNMSMKGKSRPEGQMYTPYRTDSESQEVIGRTNSHLTRARGVELTRSGRSRFRPYQRRSSKEAAMEGFSNEEKHQFVL
ncbi:hypothetical protein TNCT_225921 [Trichonephila clavata]|uniref:Uncharacterized protein n=1 Tax=Trichonephila clavata TaxID=2740835 RepID=A0A8X6G8B4_TRICU|nr:hypothetical protein TNCT_225921 [Trichonephila clavata]